MRDAGVAQERAAADGRLGHVNPAAAEFVRRHHGVVGQEGAVEYLGELGRQQRRRNLGVLTDFRAEDPQPPRSQQARVDREQVVAGGIHQPLGGPQLPADPAAHRVVTLGQAEGQQAHPDHGQRGVHRHGGHRGDGRPQRDRQDRLRQRMGMAHRQNQHRQPRGEGQDRQPAQQNRRQPVHRDPLRGAARPFVGPRVVRLAGLHRR